MKIAEVYATHEITIYVIKNLMFIVIRDIDIMKEIKFFEEEITKIDAVVEMYEIDKKNDNGYVLYFINSNITKSDELIDEVREKLLNYFI